VLVYAHRKDAPRHEAYRAWLVDVLESDRFYGVSELVLSSVVRVVTHPRIFADATPLETVIAFCEEIRSRPQAVTVAPGPRHWQIFTSLCADSGARGNLVPDAYLAALAIETGSEWVTTDGDYRRFRGLRVQHPLGG
jgi:toxin-antitoxin system PIN domain toxin